MNGFNMREPKLYQAHAPYPAVASSENPAAVMFLMESYSGNVSELTATTQYIYGSTVLRESNREAYEALKYIGLVEMHHLDLLATAIIALGGNPKYVTCGGRKPEQYWNGKAVSYSRVRNDVLLQNIACEKETIAQYQRQINYIPDESAKALLQRILADEIIHLHILNELLCEGDNPECDVILTK